MKEGTFMQENMLQAEEEILADGIENMYLNFSVGEEVYGIEIRYVLQIIGMQKITEMPEMPAGMKGFINLRGAVIPVSSMYSRLGKMEPEYTERTCIIVTQIGDKQAGLIVDAINETITIEPDQIAPPPTIGESYGLPTVKGIAKLPGGRVVILLQAENIYEG
jgi:purine-binding chemotaxis protein CheW